MGACLCCSSNNIRVMKYGRMSDAYHQEGRSRCRREDSIKILLEKWCVDWNNLTEGIGEWRLLVNFVMCYQVP